MSNASLVLGVTATFAILTTMFPAKGVAQESATAVDRFTVSSTVSLEAAAQLSRLYARLAHAPKRERPKTQEDWDRANAQLTRIAEPISTITADALHVTRTEDRLGGVPVLRVRPANYKPGGPIILYMHGGAFTFLSAATSLSLPALMSTATGDEVISIDYTPAPRADWHGITDQVLAVWKAVLASGVKPGSIGMIEMHRATRQLSQGETITDAIGMAAEERARQAVSRGARRDPSVDEILIFVRSFKLEPRNKALSDDEILGYGANGYCE